MEIEARPSRRNYAGWIHPCPTVAWEPDLAPGMSVCLSHEKEVTEIVVLTTQVTDDDTGGHSREPHQGRKTSGVMFAEPDPTTEEKLIQIVPLVFTRRQRVAEPIRPEKPEPVVYNAPRIGVVDSPGLCQLADGRTD